MHTVLITGASEGIGYELARCFASEGDRLILVSHNEEKLIKAEHKITDELHTEVQHVICDLSVIGNAEQLHEAVKNMHADIVINNAGLGYASKSWQIPVEQEEAMYILNDISPITLTKLFLKDMLHEGRGQIINVGSTGAFEPGPYIAGYYASKSLLVSYTRAVAEEVRNTPVRIYCFCPGPVDTAFYPKSGQKPTIGAVSPEKAAQYLFAHRGNKVMIIPGILNKLSVLGPSSWKMKLIRRMKEKNLKKTS